jgi:hypothetical protein
MHYKNVYVRNTHAHEIYRNIKDSIYPCNARFLPDKIELIIGLT